MRCPGESKAFAYFADSYADMFSLKKAIRQMDQHEERFQRAAGCYLNALMAIQEYAVETSPELTRDHQLSLRTLHRDLFQDLSIEALERSCPVLLRALEDYRMKAHACHSQREDDLRSMIVSLAMAAETMSSHNDTHSSRLKDFTEKLQTTARGTDLGKMRKDLAHHVAELRSTGQTIWQENNGSLSAIQIQLQEFQARLEQAEQRATTDALTGLLNRGEGECRLRQQINAGKVVSILLIDLNGFKQINDQWGHLCGDQVLKVFGRNLAQLVRPSDTVVRWGGDEFLVFSQTDDSIAHERAEELRTKLHAKYKIVAVGKIFEIDVSASVGVAQARNGESLDDLFARADTDMYRHKTKHKQPGIGCVLAEAYPLVAEQAQ